MSLPEGDSAGGTGRRMAIYIAIGALIAGSVGVWSLMSRETGVTWTEAPPETQGVWTTDHARYAGRAIEVTPTTVTLRRGQAGGAVPGQLTIARERFDDETRILRLEYETTEGADALEMVVEAAGEMYLVNQPDLRWISDGGAAPAPPPAFEAPAPGGGSGLPLGTIAAVLALVALGGGLLMLRGGGGTGGSLDAASLPGGAPRVIRGVWTTPDPRFEGRSIRIAHGYGFSQFGPGDIRVGGHIENVQQWKEDGERVVSLKCRTREGPLDLEMVIDRSGHMRLRGGPKSIWVRRAS